VLLIFHEQAKEGERKNKRLYLIGGRQKNCGQKTPSTYSGTGLYSIVYGLVRYVAWPQKTEDGGLA
jgi:hypothetical protein